MKKRTPILLIGLVGFLLFLSGCDSLVSKSEVDQKFGTLTIRTETGNKILLPTYLKGISENKPVVLVTLKDQCKSCKENIKALIKEQNKQHSFKVVALYVDTLSDNGSMKNERYLSELMGKSDLACTRIFEPTGAYYKILDKQDESDQSYIIQNGRILYNYKGINFLPGNQQYLMLLSALASSEKKIEDTLKYDNGRVHLIYSFNHYQRVGPWKSYYEKGQLYVIGSYHNGKETGEWKAYHKNGKLYVLGKFENGKREGVWTNYFDNGKTMSSGQYVSGKQSGNWKYYYDNGQLKQNTFYKNGKLDGDFKGYTEKGKVSSLGRYEKGKSTGDWKFYYENGKLKLETRYIQGELNGTWKNYYENGNLFTERQYDKGKLMHVVSLLNPRGKPLDKGSLKNGNGTLIIYDSDGKFLRMDQYVNGIQQNGYWEKELAGKIIAAGKKWKEIKPVSYTRTISVKSYPVNSATKIYGKYYVVIPFEAPRGKTINFLIGNPRSWGIVTDSATLVVKAFETYDLNKRFSAYVDGEKRWASSFRFVIQGGAKGIDMKELSGHKGYFYFIMNQDQYDKHRRAPYYLGYYVYTNESGLDKMRSYLKSFK
ncbi:MAG: toxin-antitoxin system YwqK family antitoxin [Bacteroidales bacterium]|nr:toxin-antitoxin system YwqK family antitoxin [Bacteroidales bacterium]